MDDIYTPFEGRSDDWSVGLSINPDRLEQYLGGEESEVFVQFRTAGEHLRVVRCIVKQVEEDNRDNDGNEKISLDESTANALCRAFSLHARMPAMRFYNSMILQEDAVIAAIEMNAPRTYSQLPWTDEQYDAMVTYCIWLQLNDKMGRSCGPNGEDIDMEIVRCTEAILKARPDDASIHVMYGNWLMLKGYMQDAVEQLEKAVELDATECFGACYTIANICLNAVNLEKQSKWNFLDRFGALAATEKCVANLTRYLELAPLGHWHMHRAWISLMFKTTQLLAQGWENLTSIEKRHPGFAAEASTRFERGAQALELYENCYGKEQSDFNSLYEQASQFIAAMYKDGLLKDPTTMPASIYVCAVPSCTNTTWNNQEGSSPKKCIRCQSVSYCSKSCQTKHWKAGHKKECPKLLAQRKERLEANPTKVKRPKVESQPQFGDKPVDWLG